MKPVRILLLYANSPEMETFSYQLGWPRHFQRHSRFLCASVNVLDRRVAARIRSVALARIGRFDAIVILHSVFSNSCCLDGWLFEAVAAAPQPKAYFIGNEYKLMPEKMAFCDDLGVELLVSQSDSSAVYQLYHSRLKCRVIGLPNTGLDTSVFFPRVPHTEREIDLGYRALEPPVYLGHDERRRIAEYFLSHAVRYGLRVDISLKPEDRFAGSDWADFLNHCKGQLGTESGGDFFELTDSTRLKVNAHLREHPSATTDEIFKKFFEGYANPVAMRIISGRNVEAAGTKTVQVLFEGDYGGYLKPDIHYISLAKDFSNIEDVIAKFRDPASCEKLVENAYEVVIHELTYGKLIDKFYEALVELL